MPLGDGFLDTYRVINAIRKANPSLKLSLEMITRGPLEVPCLTGKCWEGFPERNGAHLARALTMARANGPGGRCLGGLDWPESNGSRLSWRA